MQLLVLGTLALHATGPRPFIVMKSLLIINDLTTHLHKLNYNVLFVVQISEVEVVGKQEQMTAKDALLLWAQKVTQGYVVESQS